MVKLYEYEDVYEDRLEIVTAHPLTGNGVGIGTSPAGVFIPDDEIPNLISALQNYMSRRAREMAKRSNGRT